jgi:Arc/MetJ-type ribon-helix-helix transcriptional regulator
MTTTVNLPEKIEEALEKKVKSGEYTSKSDFVKEAVRTHLDKILLAPEAISNRAEEVRNEEAETLDWDKISDEI